MASILALRITAAAVLLGTFVPSMPAVAGLFEAELGSDAAKVAEDVKISMMNGDGKGLESGKGLVPYLKALGGPPKRVALVSFYAWDCGNKKEKSYRFYGGDYVYHVDNTRRISVDAKELDMLASELHDASIGPLKEAFASVGMQLMAPAEFLDTPARQEAYAAAKVEQGGMASLFGALQSKDAVEWQWGAPEGYRVMKVATVNDVRGNNFALATTGVGVAKLADSVGYDLAKALGVDAVVILYNVVQAESTSIRLRGAYMYMFGPNPVPDTGQGSYWKGQQYSGLYLRTDVDFIKTDKEGKLLEADYAGYGIVGQALGKRMAQHVKSKID
jgi:hypothetical protein